MKKRIISIILLLPVLFLTGCMKVYMTIDVTKEAEITGTMEILVKRDFLLSDDAVTSMQESCHEEYPDYEVTTVSKEFEDGEYSGILVSQMKDLEIFAQKEGTKIVVEIPINKMKSDLDSYAESYDSSLDVSKLKENGFSMTMAVNMPYWPTSNVGEVQGKTVMIDLLSVPEGTQWITITCMREETFYGLVAGGIACVFLLVFYFIKRRQRKSEINDDAEETKNRTV